MSERASPATSAFSLVWLERVRGFAPLAATLLGLLYASGFVIVNAYLGRYGIRELDALRTRYVGAGLLFLVFVLLAGVVATQIRTDSLRRLPERRVPLMILGAVFGPWLMAIFEALVLIRVGSGTYGTEAVDLAAAARTYLILGATNFALVGSMLIFELAQTSRAHTLVTRAWRGLATYWLIIVVLGVALVWSEVVYPQIPAFLGGGRPELVRLVTTQSVADACPPCVNDLVLLIDADDKRIVIVAKDENGRDFAVEVFLVSGSDRAVIHQAR